MGKVVVTKPAKMNTSIVLSLVIIALAIKQSHGLFFGTPNSECRSDSQCPSFGRSRCLGASFILCFGQSQSYTVSGRCLNRSNLFCTVGNILGGGRNNHNCAYRVCAECLQDSDC